MQIRPVDEQTGSAPPLQNAAKSKSFKEKSAQSMRDVSSHMVSLYFVSFLIISLRCHLWRTFLIQISASNAIHLITFHYLFRMSTSTSMALAVSAPPWSRQFLW